MPSPPTFFRASRHMIVHAPHFRPLVSAPATIVPTTCLLLTPTSTRTTTSSLHFVYFSPVSLLFDVSRLRGRARVRDVISLLFRHSLYSRTVQTEKTTSEHLKGHVYTHPSRVQMNRDTGTLCHIPSDRFLNMTVRWGLFFHDY